EPLFRLDDIAPLVNVDGTVKGKGKEIEVDVGDKGKGIAMDSTTALGQSLRNSIKNGQA
ncbi:hypothetical protein Tco_1142017, partial [Tanacetum coccineum]